jgi:serine/threonine-protein kinase
VPSRIGHYAIERKLGQGGMGVVYAARDERLKRTVALKMMSSFAHDERRARASGEKARVAASVNHPNVCQIYEIGETTASCLSPWNSLKAKRYPSAAERARSASPTRCRSNSEFSLRFRHCTLGASSTAISSRRTSFLTPHSVKLLDFGWRAWSRSRRSTQRPGLTHSVDRRGHPELHGAGTSDERGGRQPMRSLCGRCDPVRAACGSSRVSGPNGPTILHATLHEQPPALTGTPAVTAVDRVIRRALAKRPEERPHRPTRWPRAARHSWRGRGQH